MSRITSRITRRDMLQSGALASVFAASGGPLLAGGRRGGRLRIGLSGASAGDSWDMRAAPGLFMLIAGQGAVFECLAEIAADGSLRPELALRWHSDAEARVWEFELRRDVAFHDGRPFTSADVLATFDMHGARPEFLGQIARVTAPGPHALRIALHAPNPSFPYQLSHPQMAIQPAGAYGRGIGTGLYEARHFAPGARFLGARAAQHWKGESAGFVDEIELLALEAPREQRAALKAGVIDVAADLPEPAGLRGVRALRGVAATPRVQAPDVVGTALPLDNARIAARWWLA
jgi:peptide/nickel transport system substrate-binding protein